MKSIKFHYLVIAYILGIVLEEFAKIHLLMLAVFSLILLFYAGFCFFRKLKRFNYINPYILFFLLGMILASFIIASLENSLLLKLSAKKSMGQFKGIITSEIKREQNYLSFDFCVKEIEIGNKKLFLSEETRVNIRHEGQDLKIFPGERVLIKGKLSQVKKDNNDDTGLQKYLYHRRIQTFLSSYSIEIKKLDNEKSYFSEFIFKARERIKNNTYHSLPHREAGLMLGILLGDTTSIPEDIQEDFRKTGIYHILAVSGLNVTFLMILSYGFMKLIRARNWLKYPFIVLVIIFYAYLTNLQPSVLRASIMALVALGALALYREYNLLSSISLAALALLVYDPFLIYNVSFQLSFAATLAIILFMKDIEEKLKFLPRRISQGLSLTMAAQLGVAPLLIYYFNQISIISVLANLLIVSATAPVLYLGVIASLFYFFSPFFVLSNWISRVFLLYIINLSHLLASIPFSALNIPRISLYSIVFYYIFIFLMMKFLRKKSARGLVFSIIIILLIFSFSNLYEIFYPSSFHGLRANFINVGEGDSSLIQLDSGENVLIDGGETAEPVLSALGKNRVRRINLMIASHPHSDHIGGLVEVLNDYPVDLVLDSGFSNSSSTYKKFLNIIAKKKVPYKKASSGQKFSLGKDLKLEVLAPKERFFSGTESDINNNSVVVKVKYRNISMLFPGDTEIPAQEELLKLGSILDCDILKFPHQGSSDAALTPFIKEVSPKIALIMVSADNKFGHPHQITLKKLRDEGVQIYRTDQQGDITLETDGQKIGVKT